MRARLYLASAWMSRYIPGSETPENLEVANKVEVELRQALQIESNNAMAMSSLASLMYQQAQGMPDQQQKFRELDEAASWYEKLIAADPRNKEAYYSLAVIDWVK
jgi:tetratricopeptide (TPR) repeat protein